jgi:GntR family transcriptional regulator, transcriptional repressor for pyruvate dehydrogenase complex
MSMPSLKLKPIQKNKTIVEKVVDQIETLIAASKLKPGDVLPVEFKLAKTFNIGKSAMREALKILETKGVLKVVPRKGVIVRKQEEQTAKELLLTLKISPRQHLDLLALIRIHLAGMAILASENRSDSHIKRLHDTLAELETVVDLIAEKKAAKEIYKKYAKLYIKLYSLLGECTRNSLGEEILNTLVKTTNKQLPLGELILTDDPDMVRLTYQLHKKMVLSVEERDSRKAHETALKATQKLMDIVSGALAS